MGEKISILLVEDEFITAMLLKKELQKCGYEICHHVTTGDNALLSAENNCPDIILMDIGLQGVMDGIEAAEKIKFLSDIPIIFITGYENEEMREKAERINSQGYLVKPIKIEELKRIIDSCFPAL